MVRIKLPPEHNDTDETFRRQMSRDTQRSHEPWDSVEKTVAKVGIVLAVIFLAICVWIRYY